MKDPYDVLDVGRSATQDDIKRAFRKLGAQHHPDKNPGDDGAGQRFKEVNAAYQILSDSKKRAMYDRFGHAGVGGAGAGPFQGGPIDLSELNIDGIFGDLLEVLGIRFGERGDVQLELEVDFHEAAFGCERTVVYDRTQSCEGCSGTGAAPGSKMSSCSACNGRGRVRFQQGVFPIAVERGCSRCNGGGRVVVTPCEQCSGAGLCSSSTELLVRLPAGIENGATRRIQGKGHQQKGKRAGDLEVIVRVKPHEFFRRSGDDVLCALPVTFAQAVLGDEIEIPTLSGKGVLRVPGGTQPGTVLRVRGKGLPRRGVAGRGDQLCEVQVEIPTELNERQRELVMQLASELGESVQPQRRSFAEKLKDLFS